MFIFIFFLVFIIFVYLFDGYTFTEPFSFFLNHIYPRAVKYPTQLM